MWIKQKKKEPKKKIIHGDDYNIILLSSFTNLKALGEVLLVMIGILLALQVNNWNEFRKDRKIELIILQGLQKEIEQNISSIHRIIRGDSTRIIANEKLISILKDPDSEFHESMEALFGKRT